MTDRLVQTANIQDSDVKDFVVFDTETTGLYPDSEKIIEIGAVRFRDGKEAERFHSFVRPATGTSTSCPCTEALNRLGRLEAIFLPKISRRLQKPET